MKLEPCPRIWRLVIMCDRYSSTVSSPLDDDTFFATRDAIILEHEL
jgi:hypothetical protein